MEVGGLPKGKGKKDKGKGKTKDTSGGKGKGAGTQTDKNANKDKECFPCKKYGRVKADCRKGLADLKKAEGRPVGGTAAATSGTSSSSSAGQPAGKAKSKPAGGVYEMMSMFVLCLKCLWQAFRGRTNRCCLILVVVPVRFPKDLMNMQWMAVVAVLLSTVTGEKLEPGRNHGCAFKGLRRGHRVSNLSHPWIKWREAQRDTEVMSE